MSHHHEHGSRSCQQIFEKLSEYLDGDLPPDLCERIDGHMADCPPCQSFLESLRRTVKLVERIDAPAMPDEIRASVREAYERYKDGKSKD
jgi:RNA polymerase sigma-70 factor (ECF subfamily)